MAKIANTVRPLYLLLSALLLPTVLAQAQSDTNLLPSAASNSFPQCGLNCALLQQAQSACIPPAAPVSSRTTYVSCFCQSNLISSLHNSPANICDDSCTNPSDLSLIQTWFNNLCSSGGDTTQPTTTTSATSASTTTASAGTTASSAASSSSGSEPKSWYVRCLALFPFFRLLATGGQPTTDG